MTLQNLEAKWSDHLAGQNCPPVLGLASLSEDESEVIRQLVADEVARERGHDGRHSFFYCVIILPVLQYGLLAKLVKHTKRGHFGKNSRKSLELLSQSNQRDQLAMRFRGACRRSMASWLAPGDLGGHNIVAEFLHQAGLPLDRCGGFAQHVRKVERSYGLPDAEAPDAGEQLRDAVLDSLQPINVPTLKRALRGPAGPRICDVALSVVLTGDFTGINPRLGQELERVFEHAGRGALRRSAHQPFLRLGEDFGSLEIVGPIQDTGLVAVGGLTWVADGRRFPTPRTDEFVLKVTDRSRVVVELSGLVLGALPPRTFVLRLDDLAEPFLLFDERTRRQRRVGGPIPSGRYWLLHHANDTLLGAEQRYEWPDGERALSLFQIRPGTGVKLESGSGGPWSFAAALLPFFDAVGERLAHEADEPVYFGWAELPSIWLPADANEQECVSPWCLNLRDGEVEHTLTVTSTTVEVGGMVKYRVEAGDYLVSLSPGLHRFEMTLRRSERSRVEAQAEYWFWQGLIGRDTKGFKIAAPPRNLLIPECQGFAIGDTFIRHRSDMHRRHTLTFDVNGEGRAFHWSQPGVFLESQERRAGQLSATNSHHLGEAFSASLNSDRWLRIWLVEQAGWEIIVANQVWQRDIGGDQRDFVELSLASLATAFHQGGEIRLRLGGQERLLARFTSPLQPIELDAVGDELHRGYRFHFTEKVVWMRPVLRELASGQRRVLDGQQFDPTGQCVFGTEDLPQIQCSNLLDDTLPGAAPVHPVTLLVPIKGWSEGLWLIELEVRRDDHAEWEPVALHGREHAPVFICARNGQAALSTRSRLLWSSCGLGAQSSDDVILDEAGCSELLDLLTDMIALRQQGIADAARRDFGWLKDTVRSLSQRAGRAARQAQNDGLQTKLLNLACQDSNHAGFVYLPSLLSLPGAQYRELPTGDPLNDALRRCGRIAVADSIADLVRHDFAFIDLNVVTCFANFAQIACIPNGESSALEFVGFSHGRYWQSVLGTHARNQLAPDWAGDGTLGQAHYVWALAELVRRYDQPNHELRLAAANALLHSATEFRTWLQQRLGDKFVMAPSAWNAPWPNFSAPEDFLEAVPRFTSLFALAARAATVNLLEFDETLTWLESQVEQRWMAEQGIAVLVGLAPELFGHQLQFWEFIIRTRPH